MTDDQQELRTLITAAVARRLGTRVGTAPRPSSSDSAPQRGDPSHYLYLALVNPGDACLIEPDVACNHCGHCKSHGY
jgi:hypothetical protein